MIRIAHPVNRTVHGFQIVGVQDVIDTEPKEIFIVRGAYAPTGSGIGIRQ